MIGVNLHTHTTYCDGKNTPEEMIEKARALGFSSIGFSSHAYTPFDISYCMSKETEKKYINHINSLKNQYSDIEIFLGTEQDLYSEIDTTPYDYTIGSVHYIKTNDTFLPVDVSEKITNENVNTYFGGDYKKYVKAYFETVAHLDDISPDIIGHFDLVTKFNSGMRYFDENEKEYLDAAFSAIDALHCDLFELNTGAMAKGLKDTPYPALPILKRLKEKGARIILSSDCHDAAFLDFYFNESAALLKEIGFRCVTIFKDKKFTEQPL